MPVKFTTKGDMEKCPECGNCTEFIGHSRQVSEDCCEVFVVCVCGFDPTKGESSLRAEHYWGGISNETMMLALWVWNDLISEMQTKPT